MTQEKTGLEHLTPEQIQDIKTLYPEQEIDSSDGDTSPQKDDKQTNEDESKLIDEKGHQYYTETTRNPHTKESRMQIAEGELKIVEEDLE